MNKYKLKRHFTFHTIKSIDTYEERAKPFIFKFLHSNSSIEFLRSHVRKLFSLIEFMQKRVRNQQAIKTAKVEVLHNYWDKMTGNIL